MLDQVASEEDVEHLDAPADGQHREVALEGGVEQRELEVVPWSLTPPLRGSGVLAVPAGRDVAPADQDQSVERRHQRVDRPERRPAPRHRVGDPAPTRRDEHGLAARRLQHVEVPTGHQGGIALPRPPPRVLAVGGDADERTGPGLDMAGQYPTPLAGPRPVSDGDRDVTAPAAGHDRANRLDCPTVLGQSAGMLTLETLPHQIRSGDVDTVVVAFPDLQGRPVGKRVTGSFFLEHVIDHGIEVCDYLLACDVDMDPLPGLPVRQLGDRIRRPQRGHRPPDGAAPPVAPRQSVLVLCDLLTMDGDRSRCRPVGSCAARSSGPPSRRPGGQVRHRARVLPVPRLVRRSGGEALAAPEPARHARSRTTSSCRRRGRSTSSPASATR